MVLLLPTGLGLASLWSLALRARSVDGGPLAEALEQAKARLVHRGHVRLLQSCERAMPMTWGIWSPTILLPEGAGEWSAERISVVLLHELAHVQRRDCVTQLIAQAARAMYWFNPLAWLAERQMRALQEQACDDLVLRQGYAGPDYAEHLLEVSGSSILTNRMGAVALAMARKPSMERRIMSILNVKQNRQPLTVAMRCLVGAVATLLLGLIAMRVETVTADESGEAGGQQAAAGADQAAARAKEFAELREKIAAQYVTPVDEKEIAQGAIKGMLGALRDPYSDYLTPTMLADIEKQLSGTLVGIGVQLEMREKQVRVVTPLPDSPALAAGIQAGDVLLQIDGKTTSGSELPDVVKQIAGQQGTAVRLKIGRGGQELDISVTRGALKLATVKGFRRGTDNKWEYLLAGSGKIGYVQVAQFGAGTPEELKGAIEDLKQQGARGLILDLRFCPGGSLESAVAAAKLFLDRKMIVSLQGRDGTATTIRADGQAAWTEVPIVILVSGHTASAAEVFVGALQDNQRAIVLGTRTLGKGSVQTLIKLSEGSGAIKLTTSQYRLPSGRNIDKAAGGKTWGINPDEGYFVSLTRAQAKGLADRQREREIIGSKSGGDTSAEVTPQWLREQQGDPQLAAALETLTARVEKGSFVKVSNLTAEQVELALKRQAIEERREIARESLEEIEKELAGLAK
jgi:carboxyl-terminal processing protease